MGSGRALAHSFKYLIFKILGSKGGAARKVVIRPLTLVFKQILSRAP